MPLRINEGVNIPIERSAGHELLSRFSASEAILSEVLPPAQGEMGGRLGVRTISQRPRDEWCWAACIAMVSRFLGSPLTMCEVAGLRLDRDGECCSSPEVCDVGLDVDGVNEAFDRAGLATNRFRQLTFDEVRNQIEGGPALGTPNLSLPPRPIVAAIAWQRRGGHLIVISGWRSVGSTSFVKVNDPYYTSGEVNFEDLIEHYGPNNSGRWVRTWVDIRRGG